MKNMNFSQSTIIKKKSFGYGTPCSNDITQVANDRNGGCRSSIDEAARAEKTGISKYPRLEVSKIKRFRRNPAERSCPSSCIRQFESALIVIGKKATLQINDCMIYTYNMYIYIESHQSTAIDWIDRVSFIISHKPRDARREMFAAELGSKINCCCIFLVLKRDQFRQMCVEQVWHIDK